MFLFNSLWGGFENSLHLKAKKKARQYSTNVYCASNYQILENISNDDIDLTFTVNKQYVLKNNYEFIL